MPETPTYITINPSQEAAINGPDSGTWAAARGATSGTAVNYTQSTGINSGMMVVYEVSKGADVFTINRSYLRFDVSSINGTVVSAVLKIAGQSSGTADIIVIASDAFNGINNSLINSDFDNVDFNTAYSSEVATWNLNSYNNITLNSAATSEIQNSNAFILALVEHDYDYSNSAPSSAPTNVRSGWWAQDGTYPIELYVGYYPGYSHGVNGISATSMNGVNGIARSAIFAVNGVD